MTKKKSSIVSIIAIVLVLILSIGLISSLVSSEEDSISNSKVGKSIRDIQLTKSVGLKDTYTILYTDGSTSTYVVTNGKDGIDGEPGPAGVGEVEDHLFSEEIVLEDMTNIENPSNIISLDDAAINGFMTLMPIIEAGIVDNTLKSISLVVKTNNNCFYLIPLSYFTSSDYCIFSGIIPSYQGSILDIKIYIDLFNSSIMFIGDEYMCQDIAADFCLSTMVFSVIK